MANEQHRYHSSLRWNGQRKGVLSPAGLTPLEVATPPEFPGGHPGIWSPEHLFVAAAEACLMTTFLAIAENSKLAFSGYSSEAEGTLEKTDSGFMVTEIRLRPRVIVAEESVREKALKVLEKAERHCLISNSMKTRVVLEPRVEVAG